MTLNTLNDLPALPALETLAKKLAREIARVPADVDDLIQEGMIAAWRATLSGRKATHPFSMARTIMKRAMWAFYERQRPDTEPLSHPYPDHNDNQTETELREFFDALEFAYGKPTRRVAENLIEPRDPELCRRIVNEVHAKQRARRNGDPRRGAVHMVRLSQRIVREGLRIPVAEWNHTLADIRAFTREWIAR